MNSEKFSKENLVFKTRVIQALFELLSKKLKPTKRRDGKLLIKNNVRNVPSIPNALTKVTKAYQKLLTMT